MVRVENILIYLFIVNITHFQEFVWLPWL